MEEQEPHARREEIGHPSWLGTPEEEHEPVEPGPDELDKPEDLPAEADPDEPPHLQHGSPHEDRPDPYDEEDESPVP